MRRFLMVLLSVIVVGGAGLGVMNYMSSRPDATLSEEALPDAAVDD